MPSKKQLVGVRVSAEVKAAWEAAAKAAGLSLSVWVERRVMGAMSDPRPLTTHVAPPAVPPHSRPANLRKRERRPTVQLGSKPRSATCEHRRTPDQFCRHCDT
jgi:hypothetical protein